jgi:TonB family protein
MTALLAVPIFLAAAAAQPLTPSGQWIAEYADNMCVLQRDFGTGDDKVTLAIRPFPLSERTEIALVTDNRWGSGLRRGQVKVDFQSDQSPLTTKYMSVALPKAGKRVATFELDEKELERLATAKTVQFSPGTERSVALALRGVKAALKASDACEDDLMKTWGIDPEFRARIGTEAKGSPQYWITDADYPLEALKKGNIGVTAMLWAIGVDGRAHDCRIVQSSRSPVLDATACNAILKRAKYSPALDKDGKPMITWSTRRVNWVM